MKKTSCVISWLMFLTTCAGYAAPTAFVVDQATGRISVTVDGVTVLRDAAPLLRLEGRTVSAGKLVSLTTHRQQVPGLGEGEQQQVVYCGPAGELFLELTRYEGQPYLTVQAQFIGGDAPVVLEEIRLLDTRKDGALEFASPDAMRVLENGHDRWRDEDVRLLEGDIQSDSNWNHALYNVKTGRALVAGFLTHEHALTRLATRTGETGVYWAAGCVYNPPQELRPGERILSELLYLDPATGDPFESLEGYGDRVAAVNDIAPWPAADIQAHWDPWNAKYRTDITEENMLENARWVAENLLPYGMRWFGIDDGYQRMVGDWFPNNDWPSGMRAFADDVHALGLKVAIWIAPFTVHVESETARQHPEWLLEVHEFADVLLEWRVLDTSRPDVQQWIKETAGRYTYDWGFDSFNETDYVYQAVFGKKYSTGVTRSEAYRAGVKAIVRGSKPGTFLHGLNPCGLGWGLYHGVRTGNDTAPHWQSGEHWAWGPKDVVAMAARRYYLNHRVYVLDPDAFYFAHPATIKRWKVTDALSMETSKAWATLVGLLGGVTKLGDAFVDLTPEEVAVVRKVLPPTGVSARPLDLFTRQYPRVWQLKARAGEPGQVLALFDWDEPGESGPLTLDPSYIGLCHGRRYVAYDFWASRAFTFSGALRADPPRRQCQLLALRPDTGHPQYLSTDRHVTQGALTLESELWDGSRKVLYGEMRSDPKTKQTVVFFLPREPGGKGFGTPAKQTFTGADVLETRTQPVYAQDSPRTPGGEQGMLYTVKLALREWRITWRLGFEEGWCS